jgi:hypothetical protein
MESPAYIAEDITPSDGSQTPKIYRALWVGGAGNVRLIAAGSSAAVTIAGVPEGTLLPIQVKQVLLTGTTATLVVGLA